MGARKYYKLLSILEIPYRNPEFFFGIVDYMFSCDPCVLSRMNVRTNLKFSAIPILTYRMLSVFWFWDALCLNCCLGWNLSLCVLNSANPFTHGSQTTANLNCQLHGNQQTHHWVNNPRRRMCKWFLPNARNCKLGCLADSMTRDHKNGCNKRMPFNGILLDVCGCYAFWM